MSVADYIATIQAMLASRGTSTHTDEVESKYVEELDEIWLGLSHDEQRVAEHAVTKMGQPGGDRDQAISGSFGKEVQ